MEKFTEIISQANALIWGLPMIILLIGTHIFLTIRLRFPQRYIFKGIKLSVRADKGGQGDVSPFASLSTALAATIGTGNIFGVATAVALGGPGAVFWCWITGVFGIATKYGEGLLAVKFRVKNRKGGMIGGPMYALERGMKLKWLAVLFSLFTALAAFGIGNGVQANAIAEQMEGVFNIPRYATGIVLMIATALVILFGIKGIGRVCSSLVPFMAVFYVVGCLIILYMNRSFLGETVRIIFEAAFSARAVASGFVGAAVIEAMRRGISRGLFSNESGMGSAPIVAAASHARNPVRQALISSTGTFWDTVVICAMTGLVVVSSVVAYPEIDHTNGAALTFASFDKIPYVGKYILLVSLTAFAFSTILGWSYYGEKAVEYLGGLKWIIWYRIMWVLVVFVGSVLALGLVWDIADIMNALMAVPNLVSLLFLSGVIVRETRKYLWNKNLDAYADDEVPEVDK